MEKFGLTWFTKIIKTTESITYALITYNWKGKAGFRTTGFISNNETFKHLRQWGMRYDLQIQKNVCHGHCFPSLPVEIS